MTDFEQDDVQQAKHEKAEKLWNELQDCGEQLKELSYRRQEIRIQWREACKDERSTCEHDWHSDWVYNYCIKCGAHD